MSDGFVAFGYRITVDMDMVEKAIRAVLVGTLMVVVPLVGGIVFSLAVSSFPEGDGFVLFIDLWLHGFWLAIAAASIAIVVDVFVDIEEVGDD